MERWTQPKDYMGFSPDGDHLVYSQCRDSNTITRSNYATIFADLKKLALNDVDVYDFRADHWLVGWIEYILIKADAPQTVIDKAKEIEAALNDYPIYNEDHFMDLQLLEAGNYWESLPISDRVDLCRGSDVSIFAARRDTIPADDNGGLFESLVG